MAILTKLKLLLRRDISPEDFEKVTLAVLSDRKPRTVYQIMKEAGRVSGKFVPGSSLNTFLARLEDEGRVESSWQAASSGGPAGRVYRLR